MKLWKCLLSPAMTLCLVIPGTVYAVDEDPDAMEDEAKYTQTLVSLEKQLQLSLKTLEEAKTRYINGSSTPWKVRRI